MMYLYQIHNKLNTRYIDYIGYLYNFYINV